MGLMMLTLVLTQVGVTSPLSIAPNSLPPVPPSAFPPRILSSPQHDGFSLLLICVRVCCSLCEKELPNDIQFMICAEKCMRRCTSRSKAGIHSCFRASFKFSFPFWFSLSLFYKYFLVLSHKGSKRGDTRV